MMRVCILGATGSIGTSALDVIAHLDQRLRAVGLSAHSSWPALLQQARDYRPRWVCVTDEECACGVNQAELGDVQLLCGVRFPEVVGFQKEAVRHTFVVPPATPDA